MEAQKQEWIALTLVALAGLAIGYQTFRKFLAEPLAKALLKKGKVKWAMRIYPRFNAKTGTGASKGEDCCD